MTKKEKENSMNLFGKKIAVTTAGLMAMSVMGCATTQTPQELVDARSAYLHAQSGPASQYTPDQVHEAKVALDKAEQSFVDEPSNQKTRDLAYIAQRRAELAEANAANAQAQS